MNDLEKYFTNNKGRLIHKWMHFFDIYDKHFSRFRNTSVNIVEIGVFQGGSLRMWKDYFGDKCKIYGIDINPDCSVFSEDQIEIIIGNQEDNIFLKSLIDKIPKIDILIDDGGHLMNQQINTFKILFPHISKNGIYLCEDLHTSYWKSYGGGYKNPKTFIEFSKNLVDKINAWHSEESQLEVTDFTKSAHSLHYYDSILVIEKKEKTKPYSKKTGVATISEYNHVPIEDSRTSNFFNPIRKIKKIILNFFKTFS